MDSDPQSGAISELLGVDRKMPRLVLTTGLAIVLELGSLILVLLAAGPALSNWRTPGSEEKPTPMPVMVPSSADRTYWNRQRGATAIGNHQGDRHARS